MPDASREISQRGGRTRVERNERSLQWWTERNIITPEIEDHTRVYTHAEAVLVGVVQELRRCGFCLQAIHTSLHRIQSRLIQRPHLLLIGRTAKHVVAAENDPDAVSAMLQLSQPGIPAVLVDVQEISYRLVGRSGACSHLGARTFSVAQQKTEPWRLWKP